MIGGVSRACRCGSRYGHVRGANAGHGRRGARRACAAGDAGHGCPCSGSPPALVGLIWPLATAASAAHSRSRLSASSLTTGAVWIFDLAWCTAAWANGEGNGAPPIETGRPGDGHASPPWSRFPRRRRHGLRTRGASSDLTPQVNLDPSKLRNGSPPILCGRRTSEVALAATHNSMADECRALHRRTSEARSSRSSSAAESPRS